MKKHKISFISVICIAIVLMVSFVYYGAINNGVVEEKTVQTENNIENINEEQGNKEGEVKSEKLVSDDENEDESQDENPETLSGNNIDSSDSFKTENDSQSDDFQNKLFCTISVRCDEAVGKIKGKNEIIPADGIIYAEKRVEFVDGESVFDVLLREMTGNNIHLEFTKTPIYNSMYIEGIGNIYEFDCGGTSGWKYKVNGEFLNVGCSSYKLKNGDKVEWIYVCEFDSTE